MTHATDVRAAQQGMAHQFSIGGFSPWCSGKASPQKLKVQGLIPPKPDVRALFFLYPPIELSVMNARPGGRHFHCLSLVE